MFLDTKLHNKGNEHQFKCHWECRGYSKYDNLPKSILNPKSMPKLIDLNYLFDC